MKVYIAGPMTGLPHFNRPAFQQAAINLSFEKHVPLNPAILPDGLTEADYMAIGLTMLQRAEAIYLLTGWQFSAGARAEHALALKVGFGSNRTEGKKPWLRQPVHISSGGFA